MRVIFIIFATLCCFGFGKKLPSDYQTCKFQDPERFNACMKPAVQLALSKLKDGIPELNIPSADPLEATQASFSEGTGSFHFKLSFANLKIYGLSESSVVETDAKLTPTTFQLRLKGRALEYRLESDCAMEGQILVLPIRRKGPCKLNFVNPTTDFFLSGDLYEKKGKNYIQITNATVDIKPEKLQGQFEALFEADESIAKQLNMVVNENWKEIYDGFKEPLGELYRAIFVNYATGVLSQVPFEELFPK